MAGRPSGAGQPKYYGPKRPSSGTDVCSDAFVPAAARRCVLAVLALMVAALSFPGGTPSVTRPMLWLTRPQQGVRAVSAGHAFPTLRLTPSSIGAAPIEGDDALLNQLRAADIPSVGGVGSAAQPAAASQPTTGGWWSDPGHPDSRPPTGPPPGPPASGAVAATEWQPLARDGEAGAAAPGQWWTPTTAAAAAVAAVAAAAGVGIAGALAGASAAAAPRPGRGSGMCGTVSRVAAGLNSPPEDKRWRTIMVRKCPDGLTEQHLAYHWRELGESAIVDVAWVVERGVFTGAALVEFQTVALAHEAAAYSPIVFNGLACPHCHSAWPYSTLSPSHTLLIANCPPSVEEGFLWQYYGQLGPDAVARILPFWANDRGGRRSYTFVDLKSPQLAKLASRLPAPVVDGVVLGVAHLGTGGKSGVDTKRVREVALARIQEHMQRLSEEARPTPDLLVDAAVPRLWTRSELAARPFRKDFHSHVAPWVWERAPEEGAAFLHEKQITVRGADDLRPVMESAEVDFSNDVNAYLAFHLTAPTPLQSVAWPAILSGRDALIIAPPDNGRVLAFVLPTLVHILAQPPVQPEEGPICLVLVPSRELVQKVSTELEKFEFPAEMQVAAVHGGREGAANRVSQATKLLTGCEVVVGTPGRMLEFWESGVLSLDRVTMVVVMEADFMLNGQLQGQVRSLVDQVRPDRQLLLFASASAPHLDTAVRDFLEDPVTIMVGDGEEAPLPANVQQRFIFPPPSRPGQEDLLLDVLKSNAQQNPECSRTVVFCLRAYVEHLAQGLSMFFPHVYGMSASSSQIERDQALYTFRAEPHSILVATEVVARGVDLGQVACVVNFQLPSTFATYATRLSVAGQAGRPAAAVSFVTPNDRRLVPDLIEGLRRVGQPVPTRLFDFLPYALEDGPPRESRPALPDGPMAGRGDQRRLAADPGRGGARLQLPDFNDDADGD